MTNMNWGKREQDIKEAKLKELLLDYNHFRFECEDAFSRLGNNFTELFEAAEIQPRSFWRKTLWQQLWDEVDASIEEAFERFDENKLLDPIASYYAETEIMNEMREHEENQEMEEVK